MLFCVTIVDRMQRRLFILLCAVYIIVLFACPVRHKKKGSRKILISVDAS